MFFFGLTSHFDTGQLSNDLSSLLRYNSLISEDTVAQFGSFLLDQSVAEYNPLFDLHFLTKYILEKLVPVWEE